MRTPHHNTDGLAGRLARWLGRLGVCLVLAGCQVPAARPEIASTAPDGPSRCNVLVRQVLEDTAVEMVTCPLQTTTEVVGGTAACLISAGREVFAKRFLIPLHGPPPALDEGRGTLDASELEHALDRITHHPLQPALVQMDVDGEEALRRLEDLLDHAAHSIDVLMYQWDSDALGWGIAQRLADRARVLPAEKSCPAVRILIDGGGNLIHGPPSCTTCREANEVLGWLAQQPNVEVLRTRNALACFDHRKLVIIDGQRVWTGGRNFTLASFFEYHDLSFTVDGALVQDFAGSFEKTWERSGGKERSTPGPAPKIIEEGNAWARVVGTGIKRQDLARVLYRAVDHSWHHVYLENPYITDNILWCKLAKARQRGADVRVIFAADSQSHLIDRAMRVTANRLLRIGVRVYMHPGTTHVKSASVDTLWAYMGTGNFDNLSMRRNNEIGMAIGCGPLIEELEHAVFLRDFHPEWELMAPLPVSLKDYLCELFANLVL